jgi:hypothetical protein
MDKTAFNIFKNESEYENAPPYRNNEFVPEEDFVFKAGVPYEISLFKNTSEKTGTQYLRVTAKVNEWAIENKDVYSHLKDVTDSIKEQEADKKDMPNDDIEF